MLNPIFLTTLIVLPILCRADAYQEQIRTGRHPLIIDSSTLTNTNQDYEIQLLDPPTWNYQHCLALQELQIDYDSNDEKYSYDVRYNGDNTKMVVSMSSAHPAKVKKVSIRYLLIQNSYSQQYLKVIHFRYQPTPASKLDKNHKIKEKSSQGTIPSPAQHYHFLLAMDMTSASCNNITFTCNSSYQASSGDFKVDIRTIDYHVVWVYLISFDILIYNKEKLKTQKHYYFRASTALSVQGWSNTAQNYFTYTNLDQYPVFYGVSSLKNYTLVNVPGHTLSILLSNSSTQLTAITKQDQLINVDYFIFHRLPDCNASFGFVWNSTSEYCQCSLGNYLAPSGQCQSCIITHCQRCINTTECISCSSGFKVKALTASIGTTVNQCAIDCQTLISPYCTDCPNQTTCTQCFGGYTLVNGNCSLNCSDSEIAQQFEQCDDGNLFDNDGCSSTCQLQTEYFTCSNSTPNGKSSCKLICFELTTIAMVKEPTANQVTVSFSLQPQFVYGYDTQDWMEMFDTQQEGLSIEAAEYSVEDGLLRVRVSYDENVNFDSVGANIKPDKISSALYSDINSTKVGLPSISQNNLSLSHHSDSVYLLAKIVNIVTYLTVGLVLLFFVVGNFGSKLAALQSIALCQLTALMQMSLSDMSPTFATLQPLIISIGATPLFKSSTFYEYEELPTYLKYLEVSRNYIYFVNIFLIFLITPIVIGLILKCLASRNPSHRLLQRAWKNTLATFTLYPLIFLSYSFLMIFAVNLRYFQAILDTGIGMLICSILIITLVVYLIVMDKMALHFGSFRNKFQRFNISQYHYIFECTERAATAILLVCVGPGIMGSAVVCVIFLALALFIGIKKPYMLTIWKRALCMKITAVIINLIYLGVNITENDSSFSLYAPFAIIALILTALIISIVFSLPDVKQYCQDSKAKLNTPLSTDECHKLQVKQMQQKIFQFERSPFTGIGIESMSGINLVRDRWAWDNYPKLYSLDIMNLLQKGNKKVNQEEQGQQRSSEHEQKNKSQLERDELKKQYNAI